MVEVEDMMSPQTVVNTTIAPRLDSAVMKALGYKHFIEGWGGKEFAAMDDRDGRLDWSTMIPSIRSAYDSEDALTLLKKTVIRVRAVVDKFHLEEDNGLFTFNLHDDGEWVGRFNGSGSHAYARTRSWPECVTRVCLIVLLELNRARDE